MFPDPKESEAQNLPAQDNEAGLACTSIGSDPSFTYILVKGIRGLWLCDTCGWLGGFYLFQHRSACLFPVRVCCRAFPAGLEVDEAGGRRFHCLGAAVELADCYTFPRSSCSFSHAWATCVPLHDRGHQRAACRSPTSSGWRGVRTGREFQSMRGLWLPPPPHFLSTFPSPTTCP